MARRGAQAGFTLPELLVASALGLVALATFLFFNRFQLFALRNQATQLDVQTTARAIVDLMARELRPPGADPKCAKNFESIGKGTATELRIQADLNGNGAIDQPDENMTYSVECRRKQGGKDRRRRDGRAGVGREAHGTNDPVLRWCRDRAGANRLPGRVDRSSTFDRAARAPGAIYLAADGTFKKLQEERGQLLRASGRLQSE